MITLLKEAGFNLDGVESDLSTQSLRNTLVNVCLRPFEGPKEFLPILKLTPRERLLRALIELDALKKQFDDRNIPVTIFKDSIQDLKYRMDRYRFLEKKEGLSESDCVWLRYMFRFEMFELGTLRFQHFPLSYSEIERSGEDAMPLSHEIKQRFPEGMMCLNVHIKKDADLSSQAVDASFEKARQFFSRYFKEYTYQAFVTRTWLIDPGVVSLLDSKSNIAQFARRFEIVAREPITYQTLSRVYGTTDLKIIESLPKETTLERKAYLNIDKLGVAFGMIPF